MEPFDGIWDITRLARAMRRETKANPASALEVLRGQPKSVRYLAVWQTFYARLRVLARQARSEELSPLQARDWFRSPASDTERYCRSYVLYMLAVMRGEEELAELHRAEMKALNVTRFVRSALIVT